MNIERRSLCIDEIETDAPLLTVESRSEKREDGEDVASEWIVGYAAKFGVLSLDLGDFVERLDPGAFAIVSERRGRRQPLETRALWNHDPNFPLARYPGTLRMTVDDVGLKYEFPVPDTTYGRDLASNIRARIVRGSSFSFTVPEGGESWSVENGRSVRTVTKVDEVVDVGPVTFPAYPDATAEVAQRSYQQFMRQRTAKANRRMAAAAKAREIREWMKVHGVAG